MTKKRILLLVFVTLLFSGIMCILFTITLKNDARLRQPTPMHLKIRFNDQELERLEFNDQDLEDLLNVSNRKEWIELYEKKIKSYSKYIKKIVAEIKDIPRNLDKQAKIERYKKIFQENDIYTKEIETTDGMFRFVAFRFILIKEFLDKYKNKMSDDPDLIEIFDVILKLLPLEFKYNAVYVIRDRILQPEYEDILKRQVDKEKPMREKYKIYLLDIMQKYHSKNPGGKKIKVINHEDMVALEELRYRIMDLDSDIWNLFISIFAEDKELHRGYSEVYGILANTIQNIILIEEFLYDIYTIECALYEVRVSSDTLHS